MVHIHIRTSALAITAALGFAAPALADPYVGGGYGAGDWQINGGIIDGYTKEVNGAYVLAGFDFPIGGNVFAAAEVDFSTIGGDDFDTQAHVRGLIGTDFAGIEVFVAAGIAITTGEYPDFYDGFIGDYPTGRHLGIGVNIPINDNMKARIEAIRDTYSGESKFPEWVVNQVRVAAMFRF